MGGAMPPPLTSAIATAVAELVDADRPPSHDELTRLFGAVGLDGLDPGTQTGKLKRARAVLGEAARANPAPGSALAEHIVQSVAAHGGFRADSPTFVGRQLVENLRSALRREGFRLDDDGSIVPALLDGLEGRELNKALRDYVERIRRGATDAALVTGSGKDLLEAVARQTVVERAGSYDERLGFPGTLYQAFEAKGLGAPSLNAMREFKKLLDPDARVAFQQALYFLGTTVNELRHAEGTGHGRPFPASVTDQEARAAVDVIALIAALLLDT